ncbi:MAG: LptA/OstA family protein, partial [Acidobacteriaceae bacterium]
NFDHNVLVREPESDSTISAQQLSVLPYPAGSPASASPGSISQIIATGEVKLDQPGRRATGERLLYDSQDAKFVLTGAPNAPPCIFDAEHGSVTGDSLTFYSRDDRVLVESHGKRTVTHTKLVSKK